MCGDKKMNLECSVALLKSELKIEREKTMLEKYKAVVLQDRIAELRAGIEEAGAMNVDSIIKIDRLEKKLRLKDEALEKIKKIVNTKPRTTADDVILDIIKNLKGEKE